MQLPLLVTFANDAGLSAPFGRAQGHLGRRWRTASRSRARILEINTLFSGGGMSSMLSTVWLILGAMSFGAMMDYGGFNPRLIAARRSNA